MIVRLYYYSFVFETSWLRVESTVCGRNLKDAKRQAMVEMIKSDLPRLPESWQKDPARVAKHITVTRKYGRRTERFDTDKWRYVS